MLTSLLVGNEVDLEPNSELRFPPTIPGQDRRYDTVSGTTCGSKVYVVYENGRAYPVRLDSETCGSSLDSELTS